MRKSKMFGIIIAMIHIIKMWLMVRKAYAIALKSIDLQRKDHDRDGIQDPGVLSTTRYCIRRDILSIKGKTQFPISFEESNKKEHYPNAQAVVDSCIEAEFLREIGESNKDLSGGVILTAKGIRFRSLSYLLKYLIEEIGIILTYTLGIVTGLSALGIGKLIIYLLKRISN